MSPALYLLLGAAYPVSVLVSVRWLEAVASGPEWRRPPLELALLGPLVLPVAIVWLLLFSHRKAGGK